MRDGDLEVPTWHLELVLVMRSKYQPLLPLIEDLSRRVDTQDAVIADLVRSSHQLVEGPGKSKARPIGFTADIESAKK